MSKHHGTRRLTLWSDCAAIVPEGSCEAAGGRVRMETVLTAHAWLAWLPLLQHHAPNA